MTFVSVPDLLNSDVGDVRGAPGWDPGEPNSITRSWRSAIRRVMTQIESEQPDFVLVAGDLVEGRWHRDDDKVRIFGPVGTLGKKGRAVWRAARTYYPQWLQRFASRGLEVHAALGDHEIGDNPWPAGRQKTRLVRAYKNAWARWLTRDRYEDRPFGTWFEKTAYSFVRGNTLFVTVDVFHKGDDAAIHTGVVRGQLQWLRETLQAARANPAIDNIIVQGHVPVLTPVRTSYSSGLTMEGGRGSAFWQTLEEYDVDLYLAGEAHDMTASNAGGVEQVVHGGVIGYGDGHNYLVGRIYADRIELELKWAPLTHEASARLWQTSRHRPFAAVTLGTYESAGSLVIDKSGEELVPRRSGYFLPYLGLDPPR